MFCRHSNLLKSKFKMSFFIVVTIFLFTELGYPQEKEIAKYPERPITFIQPFAAGSASTIMITQLCNEAQKFLGQPFVVLNKPGGSSAIGISAVASSKPDGYTLGNCGHSPVCVLPHQEKVPYDPIRDLRFIMQFAGYTSGVIVKPDSPFKTFKDLINYARQNPKKATYSTTSVFDLNHLITEQIAKKENVEFTHIPMDASSQIHTQVMGGHLVFGVGSIQYSLVKSGSVKILVLYKEQRTNEYPEALILKDLGYDIRCPGFYTVAGPKGIPDSIANKLEDAFTRAIKAPNFVKLMEDLKTPIEYRNSKDLENYVALNYEYFGKLIKEMGFKK